MYVNGIGFYTIECLPGVNHNTVINWVKEVALKLPDAPEHSEIPEVAQVDEVETFVSKKNKNWLWTAVNNGLPG
jgi:transposase-like protein